MYLVFPGAGWKLPTRPCWPTTSPPWQSCPSWCPRALQCSSWSIERSTAGMNGSRTGWLFSASGASAASSGQLGVWPSWTSDLSLTLFSSSPASSTLFKVCACGILCQLNTYRLQSVQIALGVYIMLLYFASTGRQAISFSTVWNILNFCSLIRDQTTELSQQRLAFSGTAVTWTHIPIQRIKRLEINHDKRLCSFTLLLPPL